MEEVEHVEQEEEVDNLKKAKEMEKVNDLMKMNEVEEVEDVAELEEVEYVEMEASFDLMQDRIVEAYREQGREGRKPTFPEFLRFLVSSSHCYHGLCLKG